MTTCAMAKRIYVKGSLVWLVGVEGRGRIIFKAIDDDYSAALAKAEKRAADSMTLDA